MELLLMLAAALLANPTVTNKLLGGAGYLAGLGEADIRDLEMSRIPVWTVVLGSVVLGVGLGVWAATKLPSEWLLGDRRRSK